MGGLGDAFVFARMGEDRSVLTHQLIARFTPVSVASSLYPIRHRFSWPRTLWICFLYCFRHRRYAVCFCPPLSLYTPPPPPPSWHWGSSPRPSPSWDRTITTFRYGCDGLFDDTPLGICGVEDSLGCVAGYTVSGWSLTATACPVRLVIAETATNKTTYQ